MPAPSAASAASPMSNLSPSAVKEGYDRYGGKQGASEGGVGASALGRSMDYARGLNQRREVDRQNMGKGLKGLARGGLKHAVGGKEGGQLIAAIDSDTSNLVFAICLVAAIIKDSIDLLGNAALGLLGAATESIFGAISAALSWIPFVGQFLAAGVQIIPLGISWGTWGGVLIVKLIMMLTIWALLGWKMRAFRTGARVALRMFFWAFQWIMGLVTVVDVVPVIDMIPWETLAVGFGWLATLMLAKTTEEKEEEKQGGTAQGALANVRPDRVKQAYQSYRAQEQANEAAG